MSNQLPHHRIGVIVPLSRAKRAEEATRYGVAPSLVTFGAVFLRHQVTGDWYVTATPLAFNVYSAHLYPTLVGYCVDAASTTSVEAMDRHYRYGPSNELLGGYQVLESRDASGVMQGLTSFDDWIASLEGGQLERVEDISELMPAHTELLTQPAPTGTDLDDMRAEILSGLQAVYSGQTLEDIAAASSIGVALLDLAISMGGSP